MCGDGALKAEEFDYAARVGRWNVTSPIDEFDQILDRDETWDAEAEEEGDGEPVPIPLVSRRYLVSGAVPGTTRVNIRSEEHTSELQSLMSITSDVFCLKQKPAKYDTTKHIV